MKTEAIFTKADKQTYAQTDVQLCAICGKLATERHHLIYGSSQRRLADIDGITMPLCRACHKDIHYNGKLGTLSKMFGQLMWERWFLTDYGDAREISEDARKEFMDRYGQSYL